MKALIDTCVIVDALQSREPFREAAEKVFLFCANQQFEGFLTAKSMTDLYYLTHRQTHSDELSRKIMSKLCNLFSLLDTSASDIRGAILSEVPDFEDAVMAETALRCGVDCIVTRNMKDYRKAPVPVFEPDDFISMLQQNLSE